MGQGANIAADLTITGTHVSSTSDGTSVDSFAGVTVADTDIRATETLTIAYDPNNGTLVDGAGYTGLHTLSGDKGIYRITGTAGQMTQELDALSFTAPGYPNAVYRVNFRLSDQNTSGASVDDANNYVYVGRQANEMPDAVSLSPQVFYGNGTFLLAGTASSPVGVVSIALSAENDSGVQDSLGLGGSNADGTFSYQDVFAPSSQRFITATEKDGLGDTASAQADYALTTGLNLPSVVRGPFRAEQDRYTADGSAEIATTLFREDGSQRVDVPAGGQTFESWQFDMFNNRGAPDTTFMFDPRHSRDVVNLFRAGGADHDTLSFSGSDFGDSVAAVLQNTRAEKGAR